MKTSFDCRRLHHICHAECCGPCPIPASTWRTHKHLAHGTILHALDDGQGFVHAMTTEGNCPFKQPDFSCAIYPTLGEPDIRNHICAKFGDETHPCKTCRYQDHTGRVRSRGERKQVTREILRATGIIIDNLKGDRSSR